MNSLLLAAAVSTASPCNGFYAYIPADRDSEVAFSVEVQQTALAVVYSDYSKIFAERQNKPDGTIQIYDRGPGGNNYWLACSGNEAFFVADGDEYHPTARIWRLVRAQGDIWAEAERLGWDIRE